VLSAAFSNDQVVTRTRSSSIVVSLRASAMAFSPSWGDGEPSLALVVGFGSKLPPLAAEWCAHCRPHITICYSTSSQPAKPIIEALGTRLSGCVVDIRALSLVIQS